MQKRLSIVNGVTMYGEHLTQKSFSKRAVFCWLVQKIRTTDLSNCEICQEIFRPQTNFQFVGFLLKLKDFVCENSPFHSKCNHTTIAIRNQQYTKCVKIHIVHSKFVIMIDTWDYLMPLELRELVVMTL